MKSKLQGRIVYDADYNGMGEFYVFEYRRVDGGDWNMETAYKVENDKISYEALTHIRKWKDLGIDFYFG